MLRKHATNCSKYFSSCCVLFFEKTNIEKQQTSIAEKEREKINSNVAGHWESTRVH